MYIKNKHRKQKRGQSTVEYILLVTAVIAVIIVFTQSGGGLRGQLNSTLNTFTTAINSESDAYQYFSDNARQAFNGEAAGVPKIGVAVCDGPGEPACT